MKIAIRTYYFVWSIIVYDLFHKYNLNILKNVRNDEGIYRVSIIEL